MYPPKEGKYYTKTSWGEKERKESDKLIEVSTPGAGKVKVYHTGYTLSPKSEKKGHK